MDLRFASLRLGASIFGERRDDVAEDRQRAVDRTRFPQVSATHHTDVSVAYECACETKSVRAPFRA